MLQTTTSGNSCCQGLSSLGLRNSEPYGLVTIAQRRNTCWCPYPCCFRCPWQGLGSWGLTSVVSILLLIFSNLIKKPRNWWCYGMQWAPSTLLCVSTPTKKAVEESLTSLRMRFSRSFPGACVNGNSSCPICKIHYLIIMYSYSVFYEYHTTGVSPMRPIFMEFPETTNEMVNTDYLFMLGS